MQLSAKVDARGLASAAKNFKFLKSKRAQTTALRAGITPAIETVHPLLMQKVRNSGGIREETGALLRAFARGIRIVEYNRNTHVWGGVAPSKSVTGSRATFTSGRQTGRRGVKGNPEGLLRKPEKYWPLLEGGTRDHEVPYKVWWSDGKFTRKVIRGRKKTVYQQTQYYDRPGPGRRQHIFKQTNKIKGIKALNAREEVFRQARSQIVSNFRQAYLAYLNQRLVFVN